MPEHDCENCPFKNEISNLSGRIDKLENQVAQDKNANTEQHRRFYDKHEESGRRQAITDERYSTILKTLEKLENNMEANKAKPQKFMDMIVGCLISGVIGAVITAVVVMLNK